MTNTFLAWNLICFIVGVLVGMILQKYFHSQQLKASHLQLGVKSVDTSKENKCDQTDPVVTISMPTQSDGHKIADTNIQGDKQ